MDAGVREKIKERCQNLAEKVLENPHLDNFLKLDLNSQLLGLKVFAYCAHDFEIILQINNLEEALNRLNNMLY